MLSTHASIIYRRAPQVIPRNTYEDKVAAKRKINVDFMNNLQLPTTLPAKVWYPHQLKSVLIAL
jgi:hypothetical protein